MDACMCPDSGVCSCCSHKLMWLLPTDGRKRKQTVKTRQGQKRMRTSIELEFKPLTSLPDPDNASPAVIPTSPKTLVSLPNAAPPSKLVNSASYNERRKRKHKIVQQQCRARQQAASLVLSRENETLHVHIQKLSATPTSCTLILAQIMILLVWRTRKVARRWL